MERPKPVIDCIRLNYLIGDLPLVIIKTPSRACTDEYIKLKMESMRFNDPDMVVEFRSLTRRQEREFRESNPRLFQDQNESPDASRTLFIKEATLWNPLLLLPLIGDARYTRIFIFSTVLPIIDDNRDDRIFNALVEVGFVTIDCPLSYGVTLNELIVHINP